MFYTVIKPSGHFRRVLSQYKTWLRLLYLLTIWRYINSTSDHYIIVIYLFICFQLKLVFAFVVIILLIIIIGKWILLHYH
jgi:hypothetical protein